MVRLIASIGFCLFLSCHPVYDSYLQEVVLNFSESGFLTKDIFQTFCEIKRNYPENVELTRERLLKACRKKIVYELFSYQVHYRLNWQNFFIMAKTVPLGEYEIVLFDSDYEVLEKAYQKFLPGRIIYEEWGEGQIQALYRIERKNLIEKLQEFPLALTPKVIEKAKN